MESITLQQVLPDAFAGNPEPPKSDLWLHDVTFRKGEYYLVEAASGTGKSSLCSFLYGARTDYAGRILFDAADCRTLSVAQWGELRRRSLSMLFQDLRLFGELTVAENLALKNELTHFLTPDRIERLLEAAGIAGKRDTPAGKLSFGQQQRVAFIRCLCQPFDPARRAGEPSRRRQRGGALGVAAGGRAGAGSGSDRHLGRQSAPAAVP